MADTPAISDLLNASYGTQAWSAIDKVNSDSNGNLIGGLAESQAARKPTAEWGNGVSAALRQVSTFVRGTAEVTALDISTWLELPVYTTAGRPAAAAANEGQLIFNSTTNRLNVDNGGTWLEVMVSGDATPSVTVVAEGGAIDAVFTDIIFDEQDFACVNNGDGSVSVAIATDLPLSILDNGTARSVVCRAPNSAGEHADVQGAGTSLVPQVFSDNGTTLAFRSIAALGSGADTLYEVDFSSLATNAFTDGTEVIDGLSWTVANSAAAGATWGITNAIGLRFSAATSTSSVFTSTTQSAAYLYLPLSSIPNWVSGRAFAVDVHLSAATFENGNDRMQVCLWGAAASPESTSASRVRGGIRGNNGGTQTIGVIATTTSTFSPDAHAVDSFSTRFDPIPSCICGYATYSSGFPDFNYVVGVNTAVGAGVDHFTSQSMRLVLAFPTASDASPTTAVTIQHLRVRRA